MKKVIVGIIALFFQSATLSQDSPPDMTDFSVFQAKTVLAYCPKYTVLVKDEKGYWSAQSQGIVWKSADSSFATNIVGFLGAQWNGANVGHITCIYSSEQHYEQSGTPQIQETLPIFLSQEHIVLQPKGNAWKTITNGVMNCNNDAISECPFQVHAKTKDINVDQTLETIKPAGPDDTD